MYQRRKRSSCPRFNIEPNRSSVDKGKVYLIYRRDGLRLKFYTGIEIPIASWIKKPKYMVDEYSNLIKRSNAISYNKKLIGLKKVLIKNIDKHEKISVGYLKYQLDDYLCKLETLNTIPFCGNTIQDNKPNRQNFNIKSKSYIMKDCVNGLYKIGRSKNPVVREKTLQSEKPSIKMIKVFTRNIEKELHNKYKEFRVRGEWFNLTKLQVHYICRHF